MDIEQKANTIYNKIQRANSATAVFRIVTPTNEVAFRTCSVAKDTMFKRAMNDARSYLIGVYDLRVKEYDLLDDMEYAIRDF